MKSLIKRFADRIIPPMIRKYVRFWSLSESSSPVMPVVKFHTVPFDKPQASRVLVLAPHPDDETLGLGGTLIKHVKAGDRVVVLFLTDGRDSTGFTHLSPEQKAETRRREAYEAAAVLGIPKDNLIFWPVHGARLAASDSLVEDIFNLLKKEKPDIVYVPFITDNQPDHQAANDLLAAVINKKAWDFEVYGYEIWTPLFPNAVVNITNEMEQKVNAVRKYELALDAVDYTNIVRGLGAFRSNHCQGGKGFAEAFFFALPQQYLALHRIWQEERNRFES